MVESQRKSILGITIIKIIGSILQILFSLIQVLYFGLSRDIELFFVAHSILVVMQSLAQAGQLSSILLPLYHKISHNFGKKNAQCAFSVVLNRIILYITPIFVFSLIFSLDITKLLIPGYSTTEIFYVSKLFQAISFSVFFQIINSFVVTLFNAEKIYGKIEIINLISLIANILSLVIFYTQFKVYSLVIGIYIGIFFQIIFTLYLFRRYKIKYFWIIKSASFDHNHFFKAVFSTFTYVISTQIYMLSFTSAISYLSPGIYATFTYTKQIVLKLRDLFINPLNTVYFSSISTLQQDSNIQKISDLVRKYSTYIFYLNTMLIIFILVNGVNIFSIIWLNKAITNNDIQLAYYFILSQFICLFVFFSIEMLFRNIVITNNYFKWLYYRWSLIQIFTAFFCYFIIPKYGYIGIILTYYINSILLLLVSLYKANTIMKKNVFNLKFEYLKLFSIIIIIFFIMKIINPHIIYSNTIFKSLLILIPFSLISLFTSLLFLKFVGKEKISVRRIFIVSKLLFKK